MNLHKLTKLLVLLTLSTPVFAAGTDKILAIHEARFESQKSSLFALGSIQQSLLTESEFRTLMGSGWVAMDGRSIVGSRLNELTKGRLVNLPDARGRFLRTAGGSAVAVGEVQAQSTSASGLSCKSSVDISHDHGAHFHELSTTGDIESGVLGATGRLSVNAGNVMTYNKAGSGNSARTVPASVKLDATIKNVDCAVSGSQETRPDNLTVNTYIKIN